MPKTKSVVPIEEQFARLCDMFDALRADVNEILATQEEILEKLQNLDLPGPDFSVFNNE